MSICIDFNHLIVWGILNHRRKVLYLHLKTSGLFFLSCAYTTVGCNAHTFTFFIRIQLMSWHNNTNFTFSTAIAFNGVAYFLFFFFAAVLSLMSVPFPFNTFRIQLFCHDRFAIPPSR